MKEEINRLKMIIKGLEVDLSTSMEQNEKLYAQLAIYDPESYKNLKLIDFKTEGIIVDIRELRILEFLKTEKLMKNLKKSEYHKNGFPYRVEQLLLGDFAISNKHCIERKRIDGGNNDLWASLLDGRLYSQCAARQANYPNNTIILEIDKSKGKIFDEHFTMKNFKSMKLTLKTVFNHHIEMTSGIEDTIDYIFRVWEKIVQDKNYHDPTNKEPRPRSLLDQQRYFISGLLDVGKEKSIELLTFFKHPLHIIKWIIMTKLEYTKGGNLKALKDCVKGFGPKFLQKNKKLLLGE